MTFCFSVYREELYAPFVNSLLSCSHNNSVLFVGLTRSFATPKFFSILSESFSYTMVPWAAYDDPTTDGSNLGVDTQIGLFVLQRLPSC